MKFYIIAGEASGDLHAANLIRAIKKQHSDSQFRAWGGDLIKEQGVTLVKHIRDLAFMGFLEVLMNIGTIFKNISFCKKDILAYQPDALILIDYPGFNLRIAEWAHKKGIKVFYYISPQIWAWKQNRGHKIKRYVDKMYVILPFEKEFYQRFNMEVEFVGHPLLDAIARFKNEKKSFTEFASENGLSNKPIVALLPGSRKQEISKMLPVFLSIEKHFPEHQFVVAAAPAQELNYYKSFTSEHTAIVQGKTYGLLLHAKAALVSSGTATLETALFNVPEVVCYKASAISVAIARWLIKVKYISLVNLVVEREIVCELIQKEVNQKRLMSELSKLLNNKTHRQKILQDYAELHEKLGGQGASQITATSMLKTLKETK